MTVGSSFSIMVTLLGKIPISTKLQFFSAAQGMCVSLCLLLLHFPIICYTSKNNRFSSGLQSVSYFNCLHGQCVSHLTFLSPLLVTLTNALISILENV